MVPRERIARERVEGGGNYFASPKTDLQFIHSGSKLLDLALGGGWAEGRISNIIGDKATGKTLLCIEACANFVRKYEKGRILYRECEAAFDPHYAQALGMPTSRVEFGDKFNTVEDLFEDLAAVCKKGKGNPILYIVDSLDSLSDRGELDRDIDQGSFGANKAKKLSEMFRRLVRDMEKVSLTLIIVSQIRDNIGVSFGRTWTRSGGRALDFYSSQTLVLAQRGQIKKTIKGVERPIGIELRAKLDKNKVGLPFRQVDFELSFGYGIDDVPSCLDWLNSVKALDALDLTKEGIKKFLKEVDAMNDADFDKTVRKIHRVVQKKWYEIESEFMPRRKKYSGYEAENLPSGTGA